MTPVTTANVSPDLSSGIGAKSKGGIADAARQFESLLIGQLLKSACDASTMTGSPGEADSAGATAIEMAQEQFAAALSANGGMGLAKMIVAAMPADRKAARQP